VPVTGKRGQMMPQPDGGRHDSHSGDAPSSRWRAPGHGKSGPRKCGKLPSGGTVGDAEGMAWGSGAAFLSYASEDAGAAARIAGALKGAGIEVWVDQSELRGGDAWDRRIRTEIRACVLFIPIISHSVKARPEGYFRLEWRLADQRTQLMAKGRVFVLPVAIDETTADEAEVPDSFTAVQWTRLSGGQVNEEFTQRVLQLLRANVTVDVPVRTAAAAPQAIDTGATLARGKAPEKSIAVLPFRNLSEGGDGEYFSDGLAEEILNALSQVEELSVVARSSSFSFRGRALDVGEVARQLHVAHILEGSVRRAGKKLRVTVQHRRCA